jgi:RNA polymerase sigma-B factor
MINTSSSFSSNSYLNNEKVNSKELFKKYKETRDPEIREELIKKYLYIAEILAKKYVNKGIDYEDIYQVACIGLIYAVDRYDLEKGFEFISFATPTIIGEIKKYFRDKGWTIKVPRRIQELSKKVNNAKNILSQKLHRVPTVKDIADYLGTTEEEILEVMEASKVYTPQSLDATYDSNSDDKDLKLEEFLGENDEYFIKIENRDFLLDVINKLDEIEKRIIEERYFKRKTQGEIAKELGVSQMTVSRMEKKIIDKFRKELTAV